MIPDLSSWVAHVRQLDASELTPCAIREASAKLRATGIPTPPLLAVLAELLELLADLLEKLRISEGGA